MHSDMLFLLIVVIPFVDHVLDTIPNAHFCYTELQTQYSTRTRIPYILNFEEEGY